ncbi:MAG: HAD-superfamily hydrolase, subfamily variant 3 [Nitrospirae bacterium]|nr:HAD-superfamily hydrolase, subfamily variant 3 [Nitrospirota bacterium]
MKPKSLLSLIPLKEIRYVLLDMDGTLLDKYFDDYFWEHLVPEKYAEMKNITFGRAKEELLAKYKTHEGTLNWTDIDFWSKEVDIDIPALKEQIRHLIEIHPHVEDFLHMLRRHRKKVYLVTNAHYKVLDIKLKKTKLGGYFNAAVTSFEIGYPKEMLEFWEKVERKLGFEKEKTLFIDDTVAVLKTAAEYGIKYILHKTYASSKAEKGISKKFPAIEDFRELMFLDDPAAEG